MSAAEGSGPRVVGLGVADDPNTHLTRSLDSVVLTYAGIETDRHAGLVTSASVRQKYAPRGAQVRNSRQLSLVSVEELAEVARRLDGPPLDWRWFGANLCLAGAPALTALEPSTRLVFESGAIVVIDGDNEPCRRTGRVLTAQLGHDVTSAFVKAAWGLRGLVGWVERPGLIRVGEVAKVVPRRSTRRSAPPLP